MQKLGIAMDNLGPAQAPYYLIRRINFFVDERPDVDCLIFYGNYIKPCFPMNCAMMQLYEAWAYDGPLIATSLATAHKLLQCPGSSDKYFYVWDLEWMRLKEKFFMDLNSIYNNTNLKLIARSENHKKVLENCWNTEVVGVVDDFNLHQLLEVISLCQK